MAKRYLATLARPLNGDEAVQFAAGTLMLEGDDKPLQPAVLEPLTATTARLTITEGRYHQVRRMFAAAGNHVAALHRDRLGGLARLDDDLGPQDAWRLMTEAIDVALVFAEPRRQMVQHDPGPSWRRSGRRNRSAMEIRTVVHFSGNRS